MTTRKTEAEKLADRNVKMANRNALARSKANAESARKPTTTEIEPTSAEIQASIKAFAATMAPAPAATPAPSFLSTCFVLDAETARRWEIVKAAR